MRRILLVLGLFLVLAILSTGAEWRVLSAGTGAESKVLSAEYQRPDSALSTLHSALSVLPVFGTDVNVSGTASANETTIASNPTNPLNFVGGANASGGTGRY